MKSKEEVREYINYMELKQLSHGTIKQYYSVLKLYLREFSNLELTQDRLNEFIANHNNQKTRSALKNYCEFRNLELKVVNPTGRMKKSRKQIIVVSPEERKLFNNYFFYKSNLLFKKKLFQEMILEKCSLKYVCGLMYILSYYGGLRKSEVVNLLPDNIELEEWLEDTSKPCRLNITGKGNVERIIYIPSIIANLIYDWKENYRKHFLELHPVLKKNLKKLFEEGVKIKPTFFFISANYWDKLFRKHSLEAVGRKINLHNLRHARTSDLYSGGVPLLELKEFLGHADISTTTRYIDLTDKQKLASLRAIANFD